MSRPESRPKHGTYTISLKVGHYLPEEISLHIKNHYLTIKGDHCTVTKDAYDKSKFSRQFKLPNEVIIDTLRYELSKDGVLRIQADKSPTARIPFQDKSDPSHLRLCVDINDYKSDEINVSYHANILLIQGMMKEQGTRENMKCFKKIIALYPDVDLSSLRCKRTKYGYLEVTAPRNLLIREKDIKIIPIRWSQ